MSSPPPAVAVPEEEPAPPSGSPPSVSPPSVSPPQVTSPTNPKNGKSDTFENMATLPVGRSHQPPSGVNVPTPMIPPTAGGPPRGGGGAPNPVRTGSADDIEKNNSANKEAEALKGRQPVSSAVAGVAATAAATAAAAKEEKRTSLFIILSFVYAKLLVVICIAYVVSEIITAHLPLVYYEALFTYLYGASILFLLYVFCFLLQESACCSGGTGAEAAERERRKIAAADQKKREKERAKAAKDKEKADKDRVRKEKKDKETQDAKQAKDAKDAKAKAAKDAKDAKAKGGRDQKGGKDPKAPKDADAQPPPPPPQPASGPQALQPSSKHAAFYQKQEGYPRKMRDLVRCKLQEERKQGPLSADTETDREQELPLLMASHQDAVEMEAGAGTIAIPERSLGRKRKTTQNNSSHGSFFLRVGAIAFGLVTMIYSGLEFGTFFETPMNSPCYQILRGVNPILQMIFTFMQMYFIFMNSRLNIHRFKVIARFGLMHVVATNLCVWIRTFVLESLKEIMAYLALSDEKKAALVTTDATPLFFGGGSNLAENFRLVTTKNKHVEAMTTATPAAVRMVQTTARTLASTVATTLRTTATTLTTLAATTPTTEPTTSTSTALPTTFTTPTTTLRTTIPTPPSTLLPFSMLASSTATSNVQPSGFSWHGPGSGVEDVAGGEPLPAMEALVSMKFNMTGQRILNSDACDRINIMGNIVQESAPYLFPFVVEYCLIGAAVVYIMWKHIGRNPRYVAEEDLEQRLESILSQRAVALARAQQGRVDCVGASKGLFFGLLLLVCAIICLILFFVLVRNPNLGILAIYLADVSHSALMALSIFAIIIGFISNNCCNDDGRSVYSCELQEPENPQEQDPAQEQDTDSEHDVEQIVQGLKFKRDEQSDLNDILLRVSAFGLFIYAVFSIIAGSVLALKREPNLLIFVTGVLAVVQVKLQLLFIADVSRRRVYLPEHDRSKPGRQIVTFLLICNIAMWIIYTFEMQKVAANPVQLDFYGFLPWSIIQRLTLPLCIFHRFHSAVTLAEIWKTSYKTRVE